MRIAFDTHSAPAARKRRRGVAPMEFIMALPFLVVLTAFIFSLAIASMCRSQAIFNARNNAWKQRYQQDAPTQSLSLTSLASSTVLGVFAGQSGGDGVVSGTGNHTWGSDGANHGLYAFVATRATAKHEVFSKSWDHETIEFTPQAPLAVDRRIFIYSLGGALSPAVNGLDGILNIFGGEPSLDNVLNALDFINDNIQRLKDLIDSAQDALEDVEDFFDF